MKNSTPSASISRNIAAASSLAGSESTHCERSHSRPHLPRARGVKVSARNNNNGELQQQHLPLFPRAPRCPTARRTPAALDAASGARIPVRNVRVARRPCLAGRRCELSLHCELTRCQSDRNGGRPQPIAHCEANSCGARRRFRCASSSSERPRGAPAVPRRTPVRAFSTLRTDRNGGRPQPIAWPGRRRAGSLHGCAERGPRAALPSPAALAPALLIAACLLLFALRLPSFTPFSAARRGKHETRKFSAPPRNFESRRKPPNITEIFDLRRPSQISKRFRETLPQDKPRHHFLGA